MEDGLTIRLDLVSRRCKRCRARDRLETNGFDVRVVLSRLFKKSEHGTQEQLAATAVLCLVTALRS